MSYRLLMQNPEFQGFVSEITERLEGHVLVVRTETDTVKIFRGQGAAEALESLLDYLKEEADGEKDREKQEQEPDDENDA